MNETDWGRLTAFIVSALVVSSVSIPFIRKLAYAYQWFDKPDQRKIHKYPTPRVGGIGIFIAFFVISLFSVLSFQDLPGNFSNPLIIFLLGSLLIFSLGVLDDLRGMNAPKKFAIQILAGLVAYWAGFHLSLLDLPVIGPVDIGLAGIPLTLLWIAGVTNAINLIDGIDGLAGGVSAIAAFFVGLVAMHNGHPEVAFIAWILAAAIAGFLPYNLKGGRIFMGDSGSLFIGYALSVLSIAACAPATVNSRAGVSLLIPIVILGLPIMDTILAMIRRLARGRGIFSADLGHIHHRLLSKLLCPKRTVLLLYVFSSILGVLALLMNYEVSYLSNAIAVIILFGVVLSIVHYGTGELKEIFHGRFNKGSRRKTPWYKNKIVARVTHRMANAKDIEHVYKLLSLAGRELDVDMLMLNVLLNAEEGKPGVIKFTWPLNGSGSNGKSLWMTQYPLSLEEHFSGTLIYGKAEWKRRRRSEEDEIWVMELGKAVYEWLIGAMKEGKIVPSDLETEVASEMVSHEVVTACQ